MSSIPEKSEKLKGYSHIQNALCTTVISSAKNPVSKTKTPTAQPILWRKNGRKKNIIILIQLFDRFFE